MRFLIDTPLSPKLALWLRQLGHDALHAGEAGLEQTSDAAIIERACSEDWVVLTAELDYPRLLALSQGQQPGLILFRGGDFSEQECMERLTQVFQKIPADILANSIVGIERTRIRLRRLRGEQ